MQVSRKMLKIVELSLMILGSICGTLSKGFKINKIIKITMVEYEEDNIDFIKDGEKSLGVEIISNIFRN